MALAGDTSRIRRIMSDVGAPELKCLGDQYGERCKGVNLTACDADSRDLPADGWAVELFFPAVYALRVEMHNNEATVLPPEFIAKYVSCSGCAAMLMRCKAV